MKLAVIGGDGIGPEVTAEALKVLNVVRDDIETTDYDLGARRYLKNGELLTDEDLASLREHDAILLGAIGAPDSVPPGVLERGLLLKMRFALDHHVNLRPSKLFDGVESPLRNPGKIDFVVVREGTEGAYTGNGGAIRVGTPHEIANETSVNTRYGAERVIRYAFELAQSRSKKLTLVHKTNVLVHGGGLWQRTVNEVAKEYPEVAVDYNHIDAATIYLVTDPSRFDVIVTDNLFGDILTDEAGAISGGIGLAASGNIDATGTNPSMFEPVHGSAPDIAGQGIADPTAAILSAAMLLRHVGDEDNAVRIEKAVAADVANRDNTQPISTTAVGDRIAAALQA
ncbi:3-isopropylmalate dehydrogenase [Corynebacterium callunae]|uniref:3-isopropylmalate dehydrogenase n=1 Tax=Corynebacterium callunae DSM 20147 TaxID=1121353 RepID=M1UEU7_9CORY|nr:3-isopropylmalate dehydrogenase [Corynebacterium callunae]AGG66630.1 3-isopropylmalate dehydrogenase [Corynebacterium callunae DSM 20147]